jgi:hypothetical protein
MYRDLREQLAAVRATGRFFAASRGPTAAQVEPHAKTDSDWQNRAVAFRTSAAVQDQRA